MPDCIPQVLLSLRQSSTRREAVQRFLDALAAHREHIEDVKRRAEQIYRCETPSRPWFQFDVTGFTYEPSRWVASELDKILDSGMQSALFKLESLPESDFVPMLGTGIAKSDLFPRMFGVTFDYPPDGSVLPRFHLIEKLPQDLVKLQDVDVTQTEPWREVVERVRFLAEETEGQVPIAYPQMQGQDTWAARLMDQAEMLMAYHTDPEAMRVIANIWSDIASRLILTLEQVAGGPAVLRPRARFYQPEWVRGLIVGDYLVVIKPERYYEVCAESWERLYRAVGPIFYHTCGPVWHTLEVMQKLPGLAGFECSYVRGQTKTTADLAAVKAQLAGKIVLCSFEWPLGGAVEDMENLTAEWLWGMSQGGGFMMQASGPAQEGRELLARLELL
jgi:hypothetical protein